MLSFPSDRSLRVGNLRLGTLTVFLPLLSLFSSSLAGEAEVLNLVDLRFKGGIFSLVLRSGGGVLSLGGTSTILLTFFIYFSMFSATSN